jgi:hypothetical protein
MVLLALWTRFFRSENQVLGDEEPAPRGYDFDYQYQRHWYSSFGSSIHWG